MHFPLETSALEFLIITIVYYRMLLFCPLCSNALTVGQGEMGLDFVCETCSYVHQIEQRITNRVYYKLKELDDVLGGKVYTPHV